MAGRCWAAGRWGGVGQARAERKLLLSSPDMSGGVIGGPGCVQVG